MSTLPPPTWERRGGPPTSPTAPLTLPQPKWQKSGGNDGTYMSGNLFDKTIDVLGTSNYAAAGAADALLSGEDVFAGAGEGIRTRKSFRDVLTERGAPDNLATSAGGFVLDVTLDPLNLLTGAGVWAKAIRHADKLDEALEVQKALTTGRRSLTEIAQGLDLHNAVPVVQAPFKAKAAGRRAVYKTWTDISGGAHDGATLYQRGRTIGYEAQIRAYNAALDAGQGTEAATRAGDIARKDAFRAFIDETLGEGAWARGQKARRAAFGRHAKESAERAARAKVTALERPKPNSVEAFFRKTIQSTESQLRTHRERFGPVGAVFADALTRTLQLADATTAEWFAHPVFAHLSKLGRVIPGDLALNEAGLRRFGKLARAIEDGTTTLDDIRKAEPEMAEAIEAMRDLLGVIADDATRSGVMTVQQDLTRQLVELRGRKGLTQLFKKLLREPAFIGTMVNKRNAKIHELAAQITALGGKVITQDGAATVLAPFRPRDLYSVRILSSRAMDDLAKSGMKSKSAQAIIENVMRVEGVDADTATELVRKAMGDVRSPLEVRFGPLQFSRELPIPDELLEQNPINSLMKYVRGSALRLSAADTFGGSDELFHTMRDVMKADGFDADEVGNIYRAAVFGNERMNKFMHHFNAMNTITKLGFRTALSQVLQLPNTIATMGVKHTLVGTVKALPWNEGKGAVERSGALLQDSIEMFLADAYSSGATRYLQFTGMTMMDQAQRIIAGAAAGSAASDWAEQAYRLMARGASRSAGEQRKFNTLVRQLEKLGISRDTVLRQQGTLAPEQVRFAIQSGARMTQFTSNALELPPAFRYAGWRFFLKLKGYSVQQTRFIKSQLIDEARKGNVLPAIRWAASMGVVGNPVWTAIRALQKDPKDQTALSRLSDIFLTGALGIPGDFANTAMMGDPRRLGQWAMGPNVGSLADIAAAPAGIVQGRGEQIARSLAPGAARQLSDLLGNWENTE